MDEPYNPAKAPDTGALLPKRPVKVFGIGMHKTSTSSLAHALYLLGYNVTGPFVTAHFSDEDALLQHVLRTAERYDAVQDMPWPAFYRLLDEQFPGSKFVLTTRDTDRWLRSVVNHFGTKRIASHSYVYGVPNAAQHEDVYRETYERHDHDVRAYFAHRPDDLLVMDIAAGDGWHQLCGFLGVEQPTVDFPHHNPTGVRTQGRVRRVLIRESLRFADRVGVPVERFTQTRVSGRQVYTSMHLLCRRFDGLIQLVGRLDGRDRQRLAGMLLVWLDEQLTWLIQADAIDRPAEVRAHLAAWDIATAWSTVSLLMRHWAGRVVDDGVTTHDHAGNAASEPMRACIDRGLRHYDRIVTSLDPDGDWKRPSDGLGPL